MRKIIASMMVSLDGFFEGPDRELDWTVESPDFERYCRDMLDASDLMIFGRVSYEMMVRYWPAAEASARTEDERAFARTMNTTPKLVLSRTLAEAAWSHARVIRDPSELAAVKQQPGKDIMVFGGAGAIESLRGAGLIDEWRLIVQPLALGAGRPLFQGLGARLSLRLIGSQALDSGVVILRYVPA